MERAELARLLGATMRVAEPTGEALVVEARDAAEFMTQFAAAVASGENAFLADPTWGATERVELRRVSAEKDELKSGDGRGWLMIPSGGTSGRLKFARHDEMTLMAAVRGFCGHFGVTCVNAVGVLPLHHVSGLMAWMRCVLTGGNYVAWDWKRLEAGELPMTRRGAGAQFVSLVPTQLHRLLAAAETVAWLREFDAVFVGGGPVWPELAEAAARAEVRVALSYGMTETAAMVVAQRPAEFRAGARSCGCAMPHARVSVNAEGLVSVAGELVFHGYFPEWRETREFTTEDLGHIDEGGQLHIEGRRDAVIISGGKKVDATAVENVLRASAQFEDVAVLGVPDAEWGEVVVACYLVGKVKPDFGVVDREVERHLLGHQRPKRWVEIAAEDWPRNAQGKLRRTELARLAVAALASDRAEPRG